MIVFIEKTMSKRDFLETIIDWTQSMLVGRSLAACYNEMLVRGRPAGADRAASFSR